jgi:hypothetical protein
MHDEEVLCIPVNSNIHYIMYELHGSIPKVCFACTRAGCAKFRVRRKSVLVWWCRSGQGGPGPACGFFQTEGSTKQLSPTGELGIGRACCHRAHQATATVTVPVPDRLKCHVRESAIMHSASLRRHTYRILDSFVGNVANEWYAANCLHSR